MMLVPYCLDRKLVYRKKHFDAMRDSRGQSWDGRPTKRSMYAATSVECVSTSCCNPSPRKTHFSLSMSINAQNGLMYGFFRVMWRSEMIKKDANSNKRPSQLWMAAEFCFSLYWKVGKWVRTTVQWKLALQPSKKRKEDLRDWSMKSI